MPASTLPTPSRAAAFRDCANRRSFGTATWRALGTSVHVLTGDPEALAPARRAVAQVLSDVDAAASRFRPDSGLSELNVAAGQGWHDVSALLMRFLRVAVDAAAWTDGLVDPTVGRALIDLGYDRTFRLVPRDGPPITVAVQAAPGWQHVELDEAAGRVRMRPGVMLDLGATAKGLASDLAAEAAGAAAVGAVLVNLGGDLRVVGSPPGGWPVLVTDDSDPDHADDGAGQVVGLHAGGLASSGSASRRWRRGGSLLHHLVDPRSGLPTGGPWRTASVTAATCVLANAASTAAVILGDEAPQWLAARGMSARLCATDGRVTTVGSWPAGIPS